MKLGVLDWGIGGVDFAERFRVRMPDIPIVYLSDSGSVPYGKLSAPALALRVARAVAFWSCIMQQKS